MKLLRVGKDIMGKFLAVAAVYPKRLRLDRLGNIYGNIWNDTDERKPVPWTWERNTSSEWWERGIEIMGILKALKSETKAPPKEEEEVLELYELGRRCMKGEGAEKDVEKAVLLYHQALGHWEIPQLDFEVGR